MGEGLSKNGHFLLYNMWMAPYERFKNVAYCSILYGFLTEF